MEPNVLTQLVKSFITSSSASTKKLKKIKPVRIRIKATGEWLQTYSKKTIWRRKGDASNALALHLQTVWSMAFKYDQHKEDYKGPDGKHYSYVEKELLMKAAKDFIKTNVIEFVEVES